MSKSTNGATEVLNVRVEADIKQRLVFDAIERGVSINDVAVGILADHFAVKFEGTGRKSPGAVVGSGGPLVLRVPAPLWRKVHAESGRSRQSKVAVVQGILRDHYDAVAA